jgi:hypothetical protein
MNINTNKNNPSGYNSNTTSQSRLGRNLAIAGGTTAGVGILGYGAYRGSRAYKASKVNKLVKTKAAKSEVTKLKVANLDPSFRKRVAKTKLITLRKRALNNSGLLPKFREKKWKYYQRVKGNLKTPTLNNAYQERLAKKSVDNISSKIKLLKFKFRINNLTANFERAKDLRRFTLAKINMYN